MEPLVVLLYGSSMLLAVLAAGLAPRANLQVAHATTWAEAGRVLAEDFPDVLIFDLTETSQDHVLPLLLTSPGLLLIGVDPCSDDLLVLSSRPHRASSMQDLIEVIDKAESTPPVVSSGEGSSAPPCPDGGFADGASWGKGGDGG